MSEEKNSKYLAILFFNQNYKRQPDLPGVGRDKEKLTELLRNYVQVPVDDSDDILEDLQFISLGLKLTPTLFQKNDFSSNQISFFYLLLGVTMNIQLLL